MKNLLLFVFFFSMAFSFAQSKHDFETGIDSTALKHHIRQKRIYHVSIGTERADTTDVEIYTYSERGFLTRFEQKDLRKPLACGYITLGSFTRSCDFAYNEAGYLINEDYVEESGVLWYMHTISNGETVSVNTYENGVLRKTVSTSRTIDKNDSSHNSEYSSISYYNELGQLEKIDCGTWDQTYFYDSNNLLIETINTSSGLYKEIYVYEYYEVN